jgi:cytochrome c biogenesis protein CcmG/thiol:disulfide interchange protein DsbE
MRRQVTPTPEGVPETMNVPVEEAGSRPAEAPVRRNRLLFALPVAAFLILAVALAIGLYRDPSLVPSPLIGKPAPDSALAEVPGFGPAFSREDFIGQVTLVNVFASWCDSCRDEHPLLVRLAEQEDIPIFGLAYKDDPEDAAGWLSDFGSPYSATGLDLDGRTAIEWGVYGVPETFLVGPDGTIVYKKIGPIAPDDLQNDILPRVAELRAQAATVGLSDLEGDAPAAETIAEVPAPGTESGTLQVAASLPNLAWLDDPRGLPETPFFLADGSKATFADFAGRAIVLNFWATWCPPCREEMPSLDRLAAEHGSDDLVVMTLSLDRGDPAQISAFYEEIGADSLEIYHDPSMSVSRALRVFGLPTTLLVDYRGKVVAQLVGTAEWDSPAALAAILPLAEEARAARLGTAQQARLDP